MFEDGVIGQGQAKEWAEGMILRITSIHLTESEETKNRMLIELLEGIALMVGPEMAKEASKKTMNEMELYVLEEQLGWN